MAYGEVREVTAKMIGACLILLSCGSFGLLISKNVRGEIMILRNLITAIEFMECELQYRLTPLPELCHRVSKVTKGGVSKLFAILSYELEQHKSPTASGCMNSALTKSAAIPDKLVRYFDNLAERMSLFDLDGQIRMLASLRCEVAQMLKSCEERYDTRSQSCKTIAFCTGAAIVILLI